MQRSWIEEWSVIAITEEVMIDGQEGDPDYVGHGDDICMFTFHLVLTHFILTSHARSRHGHTEML